MNILAVASHPDDVEFFCGGTLLKYRQQGAKIAIVLTTSGNIGSNVLTNREEIAKTREREQLEAAKYYDAEVRFLRYDDEGLIDSPEVRRKTINAIRWADPDIIFTHYPGDMSTDHNTTGTIVSRVMLSLPGKNVPADESPLTKTPSLFYWDTASGIHFEPEVYVDISDVIDLKLEALSKHKSQYEWMGVFMEDDFLEYGKILSRFRGTQAGCKYAEGFRAFRTHGYMPNFKLLP